MKEDGVYIGRKCETSASRGAVKQDIRLSFRMNDCTVDLRGKFRHGKWERGVGASNTRIS
jgi:hypothetical protein